MAIFTITLGIICFACGYYVTYVPPGTGFFHSRWYPILLKLQYGIYFSILGACCGYCLDNAILKS